MLHEPAKPVGDDPAGPYKMRLGIWMFLFYALFYVGFVAINLIRPLLMEAVVFAGMNLATVYGFALILVALIEALIYDYLCRREEHRLAQKAKPTTKSLPQSKAKAAVKSRGKGKGR